jgi:hypothetical protein
MFGGDRSVFGSEPDLDKNSFFYANSEQCGVDRLENEADMPEPRDAVANECVKRYNPQLDDTKKRITPTYQLQSGTIETATISVTLKI